MAGLNLLTPSGGYVNLSPTNTATNVSLNLPAANGSLISANTGSGAFTTSNFNSASTFGFRNRIINGDMRIDQRNAGASVTQTATFLYSVDRFGISGSVTSKFTAQQSTTAPVGFINSLLCTSSSAYSVGSSDSFSIQQRIEGLNCSDLAWGTANAASVTLSFWVRSSLTGAFGGSLRNGPADRSYPFSFVVNASNTWEQKTVSISGDTSGTWLVTSGIGLIVSFSLGAGSTLSATAGAWAAGNYVSATGAQSVVGTNGATFYITGVQLEVGSVATPFDFRSYGQELALCQRYYETSYDTGTAVGATPSTIPYNRWSTNGTANAVEKSFKVTKRSTPTVNTYDTSGNAGKIRIFDGVTDPANITPTAISGSFNSMYVTYNASASGMQFNFTANSEL